MQFNSIFYLIFFVVVVAIYYNLPERFRWLFLLLASVYFYMSFRPLFILLLFFVIAIHYISGLVIDRAKSPKTKAVFLALTIIAAVGVLFYFKYTNFVVDNLNSLLSSLDVSLHLRPLTILLPVGISFYLFKSLGYAIDVYRKKQRPEKNVGRFALFVSFFPLITAGPIERAGTQLVQIRDEKPFDYDRVMGGLNRIFWGLVKKVVIADRLALYVNNVYGSPSEFAGIPAILAAYFFTFQIYCDFSGYTDIAIGSARILGYDVMENFDRPYFAYSIPDFWRRWHISLTGWLRDYIYIPLGGNRTSTPRRYINVCITFFICGLWHGANWTFIFWGLLHGLFYIVTIAGGSRLWEVKGPEPGGRRLAGLLSILFTFHLVVFGWIFFRADTMVDALTIIHNMGGVTGRPDHLDAGLGSINLVLSIALIVGLVGAEILLGKESAREKDQRPAGVREGGVLYVVHHRICTSWCVQELRLYLFQVLMMKISSERKGKVLLILIDTLAVVSFLLVLSSKIPFIGNILVPLGKNYGDLYVMSKNNYFRVEIPAYPGEGTYRFDPLSKAQIICFGDSFSNVHEGLFPHLLQSRTKERTSFVYIRDMAVVSADPIVMLIEEGYRPKGRTFLVWELVEREIASNMADPGVTVNTVREQERESENRLEVLFSKTLIILFDKERFEYLFTNTPIMVRLLSGISTARFLLFGEISELTPKYSLDPKMLFYHGDIESYTRVFSSSEIGEIADVIQRESERLDSEYNIELIFLPIPDKYSIYGDLAGAGPYNGLIPRLTKELRKRDVPTVDLYTEYKTCRRVNGDSVLFYYPSDTHWSPAGVNIAVGRVAELIRKEASDEINEKKAPLFSRHNPEGGLGPRREN